ncbi:hypothetical protein Mapa_004822 [Marchantia paleacea]|nr:hypothetical protein Mapa_004822 [Marchantia paleacea]
MASLQVASRAAGTLLPIYQSSLTPIGCTLRVSQTFAVQREDGNSSVEPALSLSMQQGNSWAKFPGINRLQDKGRCRASLLKAEAPLETLSTNGLTAAGVDGMASAMEGSFETDASVGRVECNSRGCRPIYDDNNRTLVVGRDDEEEFSSLETRAAVYAARSLTKDLEIRPTVSFPLDFAEFLNEVWMEKTTATKYFEIALKKSPNDGKVLLQYAQFAWKVLGDLDKADELFARALEDAPNDADAHATYALFLWQTDE